MSLSRLVTNYTRFNQWANQRLADWLLSVDAELLYRETLSSFSSIDLTVQHMLRTQKFWKAFIHEQDTADFDWSVKANCAPLMLTELKQVSDEMADQFSTYQEAELLKELQLQMPWAKNKLSRYEYIVHVVNHSTFHRGQIITIARSVGIAEGVVNTDYNIFNTLK